MIKIIADSKETNSGILRDLRSRDDVELVIADLEIGDYVLSDDIIVERKESTDFVNSLIRDKRLFSQAENLAQVCSRPVWLLEGNLFNTRSSIHPNALIGSLSYLTTILGISIIPSPSAKHTAQMLHTMARHASEGLGYEISLRSAKPKDMAISCRFLVEGLPGIGPKAAQKLLDHFGSPRKIFTATTDQFREVSGIGPKTIEKIQSLLDYCG